MDKKEQKKKPLAHLKYEAKIALLKAEVLLQKEIADNNHKGFESVRDELALVGERYTKLDARNSKLYSDYIKLETRLNATIKDCDSIAKKFIESKAEIDSLETKLSKIPKWIKWIFCR